MKGGGESAVGIDGGEGEDGGERGDEMQPAKPRPAGSGGAAPRHRDAFVRVIILTLTLCWWSCLLLGRQRHHSWPGGALRRVLVVVPAGLCSVSGGPGSSCVFGAAGLGSGHRRKRYRVDDTDALVTSDIHTGHLQERWRETGGCCCNFSTGLDRWPYTLELQRTAQNHHSVD